MMPHPRPPIHLIQHLLSTLSNTFDTPLTTPDISPTTFRYPLHCPPHTIMFILAPILLVLSVLQATLGTSPSPLTEMIPLTPPPPPSIRRRHDPLALQLPALPRQPTSLIPRQRQQPRHPLVLRRLSLLDMRIRFPGTRSEAIRVAACGRWE